MKVLYRGKGLTVMYALALKGAHRGPVVWKGQAWFNARQEHKFVITLRRQRLLLVASAYQSCETNQ